MQYPSLNSVYRYGLWIFNSLTQVTYLFMHNFTPEDLLLYLYNETSPAQTASIKAALETDWSLREKFEELTMAQKELSFIKLSPDRKTVDNILNYAEKALSELSAEV